MLAEASIAKPLAPVWRTVHHLLPMYASMAQRFDLPPAPCELAQIDGNNDHEAVLRLSEWIELIDDSSQPHHLRTVLQETGSPHSDLSLQIWIQHFLAKPAKTSCDRDKMDFLLAQYLCLNLPPSMQEKKLSRAEITAVLEPVLGVCDGKLPEAIADLDALMGLAERCQSLQEFERNAVIPRGRELKFSAGDLYFSPAYLLAFTHFNAVVRGECLRLMNADLKFIGEGLQKLERQGVQFVDCTSAGWSEREPLFELKKKWATWELSGGDYSTDFYATLIGFRAAIEQALTPSVERSVGAIWDELASIRSALVTMQAQISDLSRLVTRGSFAAAKSAKSPATPQTIQQSEPERVVEPAAPAAVETVVPVAPAPQPPVVPPVAAPAPAPAVNEPEIQPPAAVVAEPAELPVVPAAIPAAIAELPVVAALPETNVCDAPLPPEFPVQVIVEEPPPVVAAPVVAKPVAAPAPVPAPNVAVATPAVAALPEVPPPAPAAPTIAPTAVPAAAPPSVQPQAADAEPQQSQPDPASVNLNEGIARVQKILAGSSKRSAAVSIAVSGTRVLLTPAEVSMFSERESACAGVVQRAVVARLYLVSALETHSKTRDKSNLASLVALAKAEQQALHTTLTDCRAQKRGRDEEILAATGKQLAAMVERAARILR